MYMFLIIVVSELIVDCFVRVFFLFILNFKLVNKFVYVGFLDLKLVLY